PHEKRFFYVYANPREFESEPAAPPVFTQQQRAPLEAFLSGGAVGNVFYGYIPQQGGTQHVVLVHPAAADAGTMAATLYLESNGRFAPAPATGGNPNPAFASRSAFGSSDASFTIPPNTRYKIVTDRPAIVFSSSAPSASSGIAASEVFGYYPGLDGSFASRNFTVYGFKPSQNAVTLVKSGAGSVTVTVAPESNGGPGTTVSLTPGSPMATVQIPPSQWTRLVGNAPFLVSLHPPVVSSTEGMPLYGVPSLSGAASGTEFFASAPPDGGFWQMCASAPLFARIVSLNRPSLQAFPEGATDSTPPYSAKGCSTLSYASSSPPQPLDFYSAIVPRTSVDTSSVPFTLSACATGRADATKERPAFGFIPGDRGVSYQTSG